MKTNVTWLWSCKHPDWNQWEARSGDVRLKAARAKDGSWDSMVQFEAKKGQSCLFRWVKGCGSLAKAKHVAEAGVAGLFQFAHEALRREMGRLGVEIPDED